MPLRGLCGAFAGRLRAPSGVLSWPSIMRHIIPILAKTMRGFNGALIAGLLAGCALPGADDWSGPHRADPQAAACLAVFAAIEEAVAGAETGDAEAVPVAGFPYLRADRFLASFANQSLDGSRLRAWSRRLQDLAATAREVEIANLPRAARARLAARVQGLITADQSTFESADHCADHLSERDLTAPAARRALERGVRVPDSYRDWWRVIGLYPLTALPVAIGFDRWKRDNLAVFDRPDRALESVGAWIAYTPPESGPTLTATEIARLLDSLRSQDPLAIPSPDADQAATLVAQFAPVWVVDTASNDDRIGAPGWGEDGTVLVDTARPTIYHRLSHTRFSGNVLLQISYMAWFPARPLTGPLDLLGGTLDAVIWRVTLGANGEPLIHDTIHGCGCYHLFFPARPMRPRVIAHPSGVTEHALAPAAAPELAPGQRIALHLASTSHYLQAVRVAPAGLENPVVTALDHMDALRSLPLANGDRRSLYGPDGLVAGSERGERFVLWPMGISEPGAMRQWGTHATAFVGRRHFDDPSLLDRAFVLQDADGS